MTQDRYTLGAREFNTIVGAIRLMAEQLAPACAVYGTEEYSSSLRHPTPYNLLFKRQLDRASADHDPSIAKLNAWNRTKGKLTEVLSILAVFKAAERLPIGDVMNVFGTSGPFELWEEGQRRYLWTQPLIRESDSKLTARPDIAITSTPDPVSPENLVRIIECKCTARIGAQLLRGEFAKAIDCHIDSYLVWSWRHPTETAVAAAHSFGLDLEGIRLTELLDQYENDPGSLCRHVVTTQTTVATRRRFLGPRPPDDHDTVPDSEPDDAS